MVLVLLGVRGRSVESQPSVVGVWECTDLSDFEHVSQFAKFTVNLGADGHYSSYLTDDDGETVDQSSGTYEVAEGRLNIGEGGDSFELRLTANEMALTAREVDEEGTSRCGRLRFHRVTN